MTICGIDRYAFCRRQYALLLDRRLRATRRKLRMAAIRGGIARTCGYVAYAASIFVIILAFGGWMNL